MWSNAGLHSWTAAFSAFSSPSSSKILNPIMFADDTNLFCQHKNTIKLFYTVNEELVSINDWFMANKLSLNIG